ncbi:hypothetical protein QT970_06880 [Microcoleus sp. herbarium8]|uniref:hypothetical protein n=1 Tax=Microcoleus sp. herbarium8 TaxID=3055436 RepID=UPI002FD46E5C
MSNKSRIDRQLPFSQLPITPQPNIHFPQISFIAIATNDFGICRYVQLLTADS